MKSEKELTKQVRRCGFCKCFGLNISTCKEEENVEFNNLTQDSKKKKKIDSKNGELNPIFSTKY